MSHLVFTSKDPQALDKLDQLWRQFRNSIVMDGREFEVKYEKGEGASKLDITFGLTNLERHKADELAARNAAKRAEREREKAGKDKPDRDKPAVTKPDKNAASPPIASATGGSGPTSQEPSQ